MEDKKMLQPELFGVEFEDNYILRTHKNLVNNPTVALTELVANAWDAGASNVRIVIPKNIGEELIIEDDGIGMTKDEFHSRWMVLGYNRLEHQGKSVQFPQGHDGGKRLAFGRNGIGRHALFCFDKAYNLETWKDGTFVKYSVGMNSKSALSAREIETGEKVGSGTRLSVVVEKNLISAEKVLEELSSRFVLDPMFKISVNGEFLEFEGLTGKISEEKVVVTLGNGKVVNLKIAFFDAGSSSRKMRYQGIAFWQSRRLVGEASWTIGKNVILDGRTTWAKRYIFIVSSDDLADYVLEDWTGFVKSPDMDCVFDKVARYIEKIFGNFNKNRINEIKDEIRKEMGENYSELSPLGKLEVDESVEYVVGKKPALSHETLKIACEAVSNLAQRRSGVELLQKLSSMSLEDVDMLNSFLDKWSIRDACEALEVVDRRLLVIEAIRKLSSDKNVDELKTLHPLLTESRWIFGPEFDSNEYASNQQLKTISKNLFHIDDAAFINPRKRPDIVVVGDRLISITGTQGFENGILGLRRVLIIELKRGGFAIGRDERNQAQGYVEDLLGMSECFDISQITAFVVGHELKEKISCAKVGNNERGIVIPATFSQLVDTAEKRLFGLKQILQERYTDETIDNFIKNSFHSA